MQLHEIARLAHEELRSVEPDLPSWYEATHKYRSGIIFGTVYLIKLPHTTVASMYPDVVLTPAQQAKARLFESIVRRLSTHIK